MARGGLPWASLCRYLSSGHRATTALIAANRRASLGVAMAVLWRISLLPIGAVWASEYHPNFQESFSSHASALHSHLLSSYSPAIAPSSPRDVNASSAAGTDVSMQIRFFKVDTIDAAHGKVSIKVRMPTYPPYPIRISPDARSGRCWYPGCPPIHTSPGLVSPLVDRHPPRLECIRLGWYHYDDLSHGVDWQ